MLAYYAKSDIGLVRKTNEDSFSCVPPNLFIIADGMGGHVAGEVASSMAVGIITDFINKFNSDLFTKEELLSNAISKANTALFEKASTDVALSGMGTTITIAYLENDTIFWAHVGDSRLYYLTENKITQLTNDHSLVWELVENKTITPNEAINHPQKNILTRAVGVHERLKIETGSLKYEYGNKFLLCTDGLTNFVDEETIQTVTMSNSPDISVDELINAANIAGGNDNITLIVIEV